MGELEVKKAESRSFFKELLQRRVLQITGFYLGGGWGVLQFLDWIVERYLLSPFLVDLALTIIVSLLPTIVTIAYFHGSPGKNTWRKREKILIPVNLILTILLVLFVFGDKNLSSIANRVSVVDESGQKIEKLVPKKGVSKGLVVYFFENESGNKEADWLQYGLTDMLLLDISQDPFINVLSPFSPDILRGFHIYQKIKDAGFPDATDIPLMLKKDIAFGLNSENFLTGTISKAGKSIEISIKVYRTRDSSILSEKIFSNSDTFSLVDDLTKFLKKVLKLPSHKNREIIDLPVKGMYTNSLKAARLVTEGGMQVVKSNDYNAAQRLFEEAVKEDTTFTIAYAQLAEIYALNNRTDMWKSTVKKMMKYLYKVPEKMQMVLKAGYYLSVKGDPGKAESILKMIITLYPNYVRGYFSLAQRKDITGDYNGAILYYNKILELDPEQYEIYKKLGNVFEKKGDLKNALVKYKKYSELFPRDSSGLLRSGKVEEKLGNFDEASDYYEKALLIEPEKTSTILLTAGLDTKRGKFAEAIKIYNEALEAAKNPRERSGVYGSMKDYYSLRGQNNKAMDAMALFYENNDLYLPPLQTLFVKIITVDLLMKNGKGKEVKKLLDDSVKQLSPPFNKVVSVGYISYYIHLGDADKAESFIPDIEVFVNLTGNKQFLLLCERRKGDIAFLRGDYEKALGNYKKVMEQDKNSIKVITQICDCLKNLNRAKEGIDYIEHGIKISPFHPQLNYTAAIIYSELNETEKTMFHLDRALKGWEGSDPGFKPAVRAGKMLNDLRAGR